MTSEWTRKCTITDHRPHALIQRGGGRWSGHPLKNYKNIGLLSNIEPDPWKTQMYRAIFQCWANIGTLAKRHFWRFAGGPKIARLLWYLDPLSPNQEKKTSSKLDPLWQNFLYPRMRRNHGTVGKIFWKPGLTTVQLEWIEAFNIVHITWGNGIIMMFFLTVKTLYI